MYHLSPAHALPKVSPVVSIGVLLPVACFVLFASIYNHNSRRRRNQGKGGEGETLLPVRSSVGRVRDAILLLGAMFCFVASSVGTFILNKFVVSLFAAPLLVVVFQCVVTCMIFGIVQRNAIRFGDWRTTLTWGCVIPILFAMMLGTSMLALDMTTVTTVYIMRNMLPIMSYPIERYLNFPGVPRVSALLVLGMGMIACGTFFYSLPSWRVELTTSGVVILFINIIFTIFDRLLQRKWLYSYDHQADPAKKLSVAACVMLNNSLGSVFLILAAAGIGEASSASYQHVRSLDVSAWCLLLVSCIIASSLSFAAMAIQQLIGATEMFALQNVCKMIVSGWASPYSTIDWCLCRLVVSH